MTDKMLVASDSELGSITSNYHSWSAKQNADSHVTMQLSSQHVACICYQERSFHRSINLIILESRSWSHWRLIQAFCNISPVYGTFKGLLMSSINDDIGKLFKSKIPTHCDNSCISAVTTDITSSYIIGFYKHLYFSAAGSTMDYYHALTMTLKRYV